MNLVHTTMLIYLGINVIGLVWTAGIIQFGVPAHLSIQNRPHKWSILIDRLPLVFLNQTILMALVWMSLTLFGDIFTMTSPGLGLLALQVGTIILLDDAWFYAWHRLMHEHKGLYNRVHRIHDKAYPPPPIEYIYVHPLEWMVGAIGPFLGLVLVHLLWGAVPAWTLWGYLVVRNLHELDIHSGIISPLGKLMPIYAPAEHHDLHHAKPTKGNYASTFELWDRVLGTYWRPR